MSNNDEEHDRPTNLRIGTFADLDRSQHKAIASDLRGALAWFRQAAADVERLGFADDGPVLCFEEGLALLNGALDGVSRLGQHEPEPPDAILVEWIQLGGPKRG
jgi:hypothetical protein